MYISPKKIIDIYYNLYAERGVLNTLTENKISPKTKHFRFFPSKYTLFILSSALAVCLILKPQISASAVNFALSGCVYRLIPSLFPFICISGILVRADFGNFCGKLIGKPFSALTGLLPSGASAYILGIFCGFPVGGRTALAVSKASSSDKNEAFLLCVLCNNAGLGYVICGIGAGIWGSTRFGVLLFAANLISAYIILLISKPFVLRKKSPQKSFSNAPANEISQDIPVLKVISESVADAAIALLKICAFVVFFTVVTESIGNAFGFIPKIEIFKTAVASLLEISSANELTRQLFLSGEQSVAVMLTFFSVGFGGMSSAMQLISFMGEQASGAKYVLFKISQGLICSALGIIFLSCFSKIY